MRDAAQFFKVLADEARLRMLWLLFNHRELCVCDFVQALGITQSKASRHLGTLRNAGLVTDRKDGLWSYYSLRPIEEPLARKHLSALRSTLADRPEASSLLARLQGWHEARNRGELCAYDHARGGDSVPTASRARQPLAPRRPRPPRVARTPRVQGGSR